MRGNTLSPDARLWRTRNVSSDIIENRFLSRSTDDQSSRWHSTALRAGARHAAPRRAALLREVSHDHPATTVDTSFPGTSSPPWKETGPSALRQRDYFLRVCFHRVADESNEISARLSLSFFFLLFSLVTFRLLIPRRIEKNLDAQANGAFTRGQCVVASRHGRSVSKKASSRSSYRHSSRMNISRAPRRHFYRVVFSSSRDPLRKGYDHVTIPQHSSSNSARCCYN